MDQKTDQKTQPDELHRLAKAESNSGTPRPIPEDMKQDDALAYNQNQLSIERTELSKIRTELAFSNSKLAAERTHLSYLRTIVSLIGSGATIYKALPLLGISHTFTRGLSLFLLLCAVYFIYKDAATYPKLKRRLEEMHRQAEKLSEKSDELIYLLEETPDSD
ncbi:MAG: DUF202 domain-containing protein [Lachnospiraceae bacterium]|nr:DUF202 domain-containing protein [Lachnospiraceae bacterium]